MKMEKIKIILTIIILLLLITSFGSYQHINTQLYTLLSDIIIALCILQIIVIEKINAKLSDEIRQLQRRYHEENR